MTYLETDVPIRPCPALFFSFIFVNGLTAK